MKKLVLIVLALFILTGLLFAAGEAETPAESNEPAELTFFMHSRNLSEDSLIWETVEREVNVDLTIIQAATKELENKLNLLLASGDIPDILTWYTNSMENTLLNGEVLLPLSDYWDTYTNIKLARTEETWDVMTFTDGKVYAMGWDMAEQGSNGLGYRADWLKSAGMDVPETLDEYLAFARWIAKSDPDGNGAADTFAFGGYKDITGLTVGSGPWFDHIYGAYGSLPNTWVEVDGIIVNGSVVPEMKEALAFLHNMYEEGLIDPEFVTDSSKRWKDKLKIGVFGAGITKLQIFDTFNQNNYYIPFVEKNPEGYWVAGAPLTGASENPVGARMNSLKGWLRTGIYNGSNNFDAALRLFDWAANVENNRFLNYGIEGEHFAYRADGSIEKLVDDESANTLGLTQFYLTYSNMLDHTSNEYRDAANVFNQYNIADIADTLFVEELTTTYERLKDMTNQAYISMIIGASPINGGFENFVEEWMASGGEELTVAVNAAYYNK